jgi:hypothetical protein
MSETGLVEAYERFKAEVNIPRQLRRRASAPLLVKPTRQWFASSKRLLIVGQETNGWNSTDRTIRSLEHFQCRTDGVATMLEAYSEFDFATTYPYRNSAFWRAFRLLTVGHEALWTNLYRTDVDGPVLQNCNAEDRKHLVRTQGHLLREEISELDPTVTLFLTGPRYDQTLYEVFADAEMQALWADVPEREVARVTSTSLPERTVRLYHPTFLQRSRRWHLLSRLSEWLENPQ